MTADARIVIEVNGAEVAREIRQVKVSLEDLKKSADKMQQGVGRTATAMLKGMRDLAQELRQTRGALEQFNKTVAGGATATLKATESSVKRTRALSDEAKAAKVAEAAERQRLQVQLNSAKLAGSAAMQEANARLSAQANMHRQMKANEAKRWVEFLNGEKTASKAGAKAGADERLAEQRRLHQQMKANEAKRWLEFLAEEQRAVKQSAAAVVSANAQKAKSYRDLSGEMAKAMVIEERARQNAMRVGGIGVVSNARMMSSAELQRASKGVEALSASAERATQKVRLTTGSIADLSIGTSSLTRLMANTSVVIQGFFAAFAIREIVHANMELERFTNTIKAVSATPQEAAASLEYLRATADRVGTSLTEIGTPFARFTLAGKNAGFTTKELQQAFFELTAASRNFGLSGADTAGVIRALEQSLSKGKFMAEEVRLQLGDRLPVAMQAMARATGKTSAELNKMFEDGQLMTDQYFIPFVRAIFDMSGGMAALNRSSQSMTAELNRLQTAFLDAAGVIGENGFNQAIADSARALNEFVKSEDGIAMLKGIGVAASAAAAVFKMLVPLIDEVVIAFTALATGALAQAVVKVAAIVAAMNPWVRGIMAATAALGVIVNVTEEWNVGNNAARKGMDLLNTSVGTAQTVTGQAATQYAVLTGKAWELNDATLAAAISQKQLNLELANSRIDEVRGRLPPDDSIGRGGRRDKELREQLALMEAQRQKIINEIRDLETRRDNLSAARIMAQVGDGAAEGVRTEQQRNAALAEGVALREKMLPLVKAEAERTQELQRITDVYAKGGLTLAQAIELTAQAHENYAKSVEKTTGAQKEQKKETREALAEFEKSSNALDTAMGRVEVQGVDSAAKNLMALKTAAAEYAKEAKNLEAEMAKGGATEQKAQEIRAQLAMVTGKLTEADKRLAQGKDYLIAQWKDESDKLRERANEIDLNTRMTLLEADGSEESRAAIFALTKERELATIAAEEHRVITQMMADAHYVEGIMAEESRVAIERKRDEYANLKRATSDALDAQEWKRYAQDVKRVADDIAGDWAETIYDGLTLKDKKFDIIQSFKDLFRRIAIEALKAQIVLPITTAIVGSAPGLFGISTPSGIANTAGSLAGVAGGRSGGIGNAMSFGSLLQSGGSSSMLYGIGEWIATSQVGQSLDLSMLDTAGAAAGEVGGLMPTLAGTQFAQGLSYSPWGILGGLGASLLGFNGTGSMLGDLAIGTVGSVGGAMAGSALGGAAYGSVLGPIGAIAGAFLGQVIGSLFADEDIPWAASVKQVRGGQARTTYQDSLDGADASKLSDALDQFMAAASGLAQLTGTTLADYQVRLVSGRGQDMFDVRTLADEELYRAWTLTPGSATKALRAMIIGGSYEGLNADAVRAAKLYTGTDAEALGSRVAFGQQFRAVTGAMMGRDQDPVEILRQQVEAKVAEIDGFLTQTAEAFGATSWQMDRANKAVREMVESMAGLNPAAEALTQGEAAVKAVNDNFAAWTPLFEQVGISAKRAAAAHRQALDDLRAGFDATIQDQILAITDPAALAARQWEQARATALRDAKAVGADLGAVKRLYDLQWGQLSGRAAADAALRERELARLGDAARLRELAGARWGGRMAAMLSGAEAGTDPWTAYATAMGEMRDRLAAGTVTVARYQELVGLLTDTYDRAAEAAAAARQEEQALAAARKAQAADLQAWLDAQKLGPLSSLNAQAQFTAAQQMFGTAARDARTSGDIGAATGAAEALLSAADAYLVRGTSEFAAIEQMVSSQLTGLGRALDLPGFASGGLASGWAVVGERGPEVVNFSSPGQVYTAEQTRGMFADQGAVVAAIESLGARIDRLAARMENAEIVAAREVKEGLSEVRRGLGEVSRELLLDKDKRRVAAGGKRA